MRHPVLVPLLLAISIAVTGVWAGTALAAGKRADTSKAAKAAKPDPKLDALHRKQALLGFQSADLQRRVTYAQDAYEDAEHHRAAASAQLTKHVVAAYRGSSPSGLSLVLVARSVNDVVQTARVNRQLSSYESHLVAELSTSAEAAYSERLRADELTDELVTTENNLAAVNDAEAQLLASRAAVLAKAASKQRARQFAAATAAQAATQQATMLASFATGTSAPVNFTMPPNVGLVPPDQVTAEMIGAYLYSKQSPMTGSGIAFLESGQRWGLDPRLLVAISGAESSFGAQTCGSYNGWGWACPNNPVQFLSWADAIETISKGLRENYVNEGRSSVLLIQQKYCPVGAANDPTGLNSAWLGNVSRFLIELGGDPGVVAVGAPSNTSAFSGPNLAEES
ncbi:MAG: hypothetical protein H7123_07650 [Thermoleophilia bacterium]|nr:hypothetical protein [Thermoleophilia bacterium]